MSATQPEPLLERDFLAYEKHLQDNPEYNALRLSVRRKLKAHVDSVQKAAKKEGVNLSAQAGLHHPYVFNNYKVREQRAYLCRSPKERKALASFFGEALGKDAETHYIQTVLELSLDQGALEVALRIHPQAWWDGENLKKRVLERGDEGEWVSILNALPQGFRLRLHDWRGEVQCPKARAEEVRQLLGSYTPGEHWLHIVRELRRDDALTMGAEVGDWVRDSMLALLPAYSFTLWSPA